MPALKFGKNVFDAAFDRYSDLFDRGFKVAVSFSGGKDSTVCFELAYMVAEQCNALPIYVVMRDEEVMFPGTFEYCERVYHREGVEFAWIYSCQPIINMFDREQPYWWVFDPELPPEEWVRQPPPFAVYEPNNSLHRICSHERWGLDRNKDMLINIVGLRTQESMRRRSGLYSMGGWYYSEDSWGVHGGRPIYDWTDDDVWKFINDFKLDYNEAYDVMYRFGVSKKRLRIAPPTMNPAGAHHLQLAARAWPVWFNKVSQRVPGIRSVARFGYHAVRPRRKLGETWEETFYRVCINNAPDWIRERSQIVVDKVLASHSRHSTKPFPQTTMCTKCGQIGSWAKLTEVMYHGEPFLTSLPANYGVDVVHPEVFRPGAGKWIDKPTF